MVNITESAQAYLIELLSKQDDDVIEALKAELEYQAKRKPEMTEREKRDGRAVTVQGDKEVPYIILKKIMATSAGSEYRDIALAVSKTAPPKADAGEG